ncbi:MAG TPA: Stp1/IreP family PP2C-type Ser/Thr phosphatase [Firmicutes bacterium]|nr:Stp1/IreP family PP2C-type Ser/Thr phosphatase [Bacillota bacterium]
MRIVAKSEKGLVRSINEDRYIATDKLIAVADGMGGHLAGEVAAQIAIDKLKDFHLNGSILESLERVFQEANRAIYENGRNNKDREGMGTTLTAIYVQDNKAYIAHVGDSRAYLIRQKELIQLTEDHSYVNQLVSLGTLSPEEAQRHPQRNILLRVLGIKEELTVDLAVVDLQAKDRLLVASDGLFSDVDKDELTNILLNDLDLLQTADQLIDLALTHGGKDNVTVVLGEV